MRQCSGRFRQLVYQTYLRHQQAFHRGEPVMTYEEFFRERQGAHYMPSKGGFRGIC